MSIAACLITFHAFFVVFSLVLFGRLAGMFATESFAGTCDHKDQNLSTSIKTENTCPLGIDLNPLNYIRFHK
jgi:hypothetical protein